MKTVKGNVLTILGIVAAIIAVSCGDTINSCESTVQMLGWAFVSLMLLATALVLNRIPHHTNEWRDAQ